MVKQYKGFTLIELLVVIAILAILSTIGAVIFGPISKNARDVRRREDINAIAQAMENNFVQTTGKYQALTSSMFSSGIPADPVNSAQYRYCARQSDTITPATGVCAGVDPTVGENTPSGDPNNKWIVCANLENSTPNYYCRKNIQASL